MGTWNIRSINGKEIELTEEFEKANLSLLCITETKKKGTEITKMKGGHILIHSGVPENERSRAGVGCIIHKELAQNIIEWKFYNERLLEVSLEIEKDRIISIIIAYGPNEDDKAANKEKFWEELQEILDRQKNITYIMGDINARIGNNNIGVETIMGKNGEGHSNSNGNRFIDFCVINDLAIMNTFFKHKDIHKYTRVEDSRNEKSIIDYIVTSREEKKNISDVRVMRGAEIGSDHYLVTMKVKTQEKEIHRNNTKVVERKTLNIKTHKLKDIEIREEYQKNITKEINKTKTIDTTNIETVWEEFKNIIEEAAKKTCGVTRIDHTKKKTHWWNDEIKKEVKEKKQRWLHYQNTRKRNDYESYKLQRTKTKEMIEKAKKADWDNFGVIMETNHKENQKLFYRVIKNQRTFKKPPLKQIKNKTGKILKNEEEILERWQEHFEELLETQDKNEDNNDTVVPVPYAENSNETEDTEEITISEIEDAMKHIRTGKAAGYDGIKSEQLKYIGEEGIKILHILFNLIWKEKKIPEDWEKAIILPIYKKGDNRVCTNYRGISLLSTTEKLYEKILENRLRQKIENTLEPSQSAFRKGHCTQDHIFTIKQMIEKTLKHNREAFICFIDMEKAFDRVPRDKIWELLRKRGVSSELIKAIQSIYKCTKNYIRAGSKLSNEFETTQGLRQGGTLSPVLFIIMLDEVMKILKGKLKKLTIGSYNLQKVHITESAYADDLAIYAKSEEDLQYNVEMWEKELQKFNMKINTEKTKVMVIGKRTRNINITINSTAIEQVQSFKYLGSIIEDKGGFEEEINNRIQSTTRAYHAINKVILNNKKISKETKMTVYKTIYQPVLLYGSENWVINNRQKSKIQAAEMKYLRRVEGVTKMDRIRSEQIRNNLNIKKILTKIEEKQLQWFGHLVRLNKNIPVRKIWKARTEGKRNRGKPQKTWDQNIEEILGNRGTNTIQAKELTLNRKEWLNYIKNF